MWLILSIIAGVALILYWGGGQNPVWGGATIGAILGLITATIYYFTGSGFRWSIVGKWVAVCILLGVAMDLPRVLKRNRK